MKLFTSFKCSIISIGNLWLVIRSKCRLKTNREQMRIMGITSLVTFLISLINHTFKSHVYSLAVYFYCWCYLPLPAMLCLSHTLALCLSTVLLSFPFFPFDIKIPGKPFHVIIVFNKLLWFTSLSFHLEVCSQYRLVRLWLPVISKLINFFYGHN